ncbi:sensor histidine kinase [Salinivirga cyanobacteriivorans]|uniref:histidine kinase n=1 Tax=Salinivirga cyanobacteriivorans TaxID=1307839 RepID=A0A0S2I333_9BACT|nr:ATP-binding protein [Salinivirga cyanobacteriivorans]ALO16706.1 Alkaline phosphatase synthesis sensor protein PhoR [Salinivirga cyanobacteriivorans]
MKSVSSKQLTLLISLIITFVSFLYWLIDFFLITSWWIGILWISSVFIVSYYTIRYILDHFIYNKIKPIYKSIHDINIKNKLARKQTEATDIITKVKNEVTIYSEHKAQEIEQLKEMERYRKEFLGNVSHELKTPIFNIQGYILTLLDGGIDDPNINKLYLERTEKSINRMISIVEDLETITRLEAGELELKYSNFDITGLVADVFEMHHMRAEEKQISLKFGPGAEKPIKVNADKKRIFEVISNLVINALKYGKAKGNIRASFYDMDAYILIEIKDDGIGISPENLPRIFERFYRVDKSRSREEGGTGLGLSIVKHIIDAHNQTINVKSDINKGTTFSFTLNKSTKK